MNGLLISLAAAAAVTTAVVGTAVLLIFGALSVAAFLPRGAPLADGLREFAGEVPRFVWRAVQLLDGLFVLVAVALGVMLTLMLS